VTDRNPSGALTTRTLYLQLPRKDMAFFDNLLESYGGLACIRTLDGMKGIVRLHIPEGLVAETRMVLEGIGKDIPLVYLTELPTDLKDSMGPE